MVRRNVNAILITRKDGYSDVIDACYRTAVEQRRSMVSAICEIVRRSPEFRKATKELQAAGRKARP